jgi:two-component system chemotaxis response regulator CheB
VPRAGVDPETTIPHHRDITVIGASAGGITALRKLLGALPAHYPAAIFVVVHVAPESPSLLHEVLARAGPLPAQRARNGESIRPGRIIVAPPDHHLLLDDGQVRVTHGPRENRHRPSIDVLFRSAAVAFGSRATGVVLSGMLDDGAAGLWAIRRRGGATLVQDPADAEFPDMPRNALEAVPTAQRLAIGDLAARLVELARETVDGEATAVPGNMAHEVRLAVESTEMEDLDTLGRRVPFTCPECGGALWELEGGAPRFRCHVGHAYSMHTLASEQTVRVEAALWAALRSLEESERLARRLAGAAEERSDSRSRSFHEESARSSAAHADVLRRLLAGQPVAANQQRA